MCASGGWLLRFGIVVKGVWGVGARSLLTSSVGCFSIGSGVLYQLTNEHEQMKQVK